MGNKFEKLDVWQISHQLVIKIYKTTAQFPKEERFRLGDQLRRSASSIPTNIVEGSSRVHKKEFAQFLNMANASLEETKYHLLLAKDLGYLNNGSYQDLQSQCEKVGRMLFGLSKAIKS